MGNFKDKVIYQIYPKSFYDTNNDGYGDLKEKTFRIAHMADITVDEVKELLDNINDILGLQ
mgnify:CR=1 FL=1